MGLRTWLFGDTKTPGRPADAPLGPVHVAKLVAISSFLPFIDTFPAFGKVDPDKWDYYFTIAAAHFAIMRSDSEAIGTGIFADLASIHEDGPKELADCSEFVKASPIGEVNGLTKELIDELLLTSHGLWVAWRCLGRPCRDSDFPAVVEIGNLLSKVAASS